MHLREISLIDTKNELETYLVEAIIDAEDNFELLSLLKK